MMSEDLAGQSMTMAQKSAEIAVELARLLKSIYDSHTQKKRSFDQGQTAVKEPNIKSGEVDLSKLKKSGSSISMQTNISARDMEVIAAKAKDYDIPISFIGKGENAENVTLAFRTDDKAAVDQILKEVMSEKLAVKPDDYLMFEMNNLGEAQTMEAMLKENDIPADIAIGANGKYMCIYEAKNAEALKIIKADMKEAHESISKDFEIGKYEIGNPKKKFTISDKSSEITITLSSLPTKENFMKICREQFGYSKHKAIMAANKFGGNLSEIQKSYFRADTRQAALLNNFERNIHLKDDSLLVRPYSFTRANFSTDNVNRYLVTNGEKAAALIPDKMSREEMADTVRNKLGVNDPETVKAIVDKAEKIEVANKVAEIKKEAEIAKQNGDIAIERRSEKFFEASQGAVKRSYDLTDKKNSVKALQKDFGISSKKAESIFQKAQNQSTLQNDFHKMAEKSKANAKPIKDKKTNKGARK